MLIVTPQKDVWTEIVEYLSEKLASLIYGGRAAFLFFLIRKVFGTVQCCL